MLTEKAEGEKNMIKEEIKLNGWKVVLAVISWLFATAFLVVLLQPKGDPGICVMASSTQEDVSVLRSAVEITDSMTKEERYKIYLSNLVIEREVLKDGKYIIEVVDYPVDYIIDDNYVIFDDYTICFAEGDDIVRAVVNSTYDVRGEKNGILVMNTSFDLIRKAS